MAQPRNNIRNPLRVGANQQQQRQQQPNPRPDNGVNDGVFYRIQEPYIMGPEAVSYVREKYGYLGNHLVFKNTKPHSHPYGAFLRKHFHALIYSMHSGIFLDIGAHAQRVCLATEEVVENGAVVKRPYSARTALTCPVLDYVDVQRHQTWGNSLYNAGRIQSLDFDNEVISQCLHRCACVAKEGQFPCQCRKNFRVTAISSIDSAYYEGVIPSMMFTLCQHPNTMCYMTFHNYAEAYDAGNFTYDLTDNEGTVAFTVDESADIMLNSFVKGNLKPYVHRIINTVGKTWFWEPIGIDDLIEDYEGQVTKSGFLCEVVESMPYGKHSYVCIQMMWIEGNKIPKGTIRLPVYKKDLQRRKHAYELQLDILNDKQRVETELEKKQSTLVILRTEFGHAFDSLVDAVYKYCTDAKVTSDNRIEFKMRCGKKGDMYKTVRVNPSDVARFLQVVSMKTDIESYVRACKMLIAKDVAAGTWSIKNWDDMYMAARIAWTMSSTAVIDLYHFFLTDETVIESNRIRTFKTLLPSWWTEFLKFIKLFFNNFFNKFALLILVVLYLGTYVAKYFGIHAHKLSLESEPFEPNPFTHGIIVLIVISLFKTMYQMFFKIGNSYKTTGQRLLSGTCVTDPGRFDSSVLNKTCEFKAQEQFDPRKYKCGLDYCLANECDCKRDIYGWQISPICVGDTLSVPTIKHSCTLTQVAASMRACSNLVQPEMKWIHEWEVVYDSLWDRMIDHIEINGFHIDLEEWLKKYPLGYRLKMRKAWQRDFDKINHVYTAFPKIEKQFTDVCYDLRNEPINECKERQICGPTDEKKALCNALINSLEKLAETAVPGFCGSKTWSKICLKLRDFESEYLDPVYVATDGSGFDMTQNKHRTSRFAYNMRRLLKKIMIDLPDELIADEIIEIVEEAIIPHVQILDKERKPIVEYSVEGRMSGDGWTSFDNTLENIADEMLASKLAKIKLTGLFKSDDALFIIERADIGKYQTIHDVLFSSTKISQTHGLGQVHKFVKYGELWEMDFLSAYFVPTYTDVGLFYRMIRIPARVFQLTPWTSNMPPNCKDTVAMAYQLCYANGLCMLAWAKGLPIFEEYGKMLCRLSEVKRNVDEDLKDVANVVKQLGGILDYNLKITEECEDIDYDCFLSFLNDRFGVTGEDVRRIEKKFKLCDDIFSEIKDPIFNLFHPEQIV